MGAYTNTQLMTRLFALALGVLGGLCQTVWSQVVGMRCGAANVGEYVIHTDCLEWTELFLRFPETASTQMVSLVLACAIAGFIAGAGGMWRPRWAVLLFLALAVANLALVVYANATGDQKGIAVILSILSVLAPALAGVALWLRGEYRSPAGRRPRSAGRVGDISP